jgi:hypothetical protein
MTFDQAMARLAALPEGSLAATWPWRGRDLNVREALYRTLEEHQMAVAEAGAHAQPSEARRILTLAQRMFGDLRGLLVGLPAELLDVVPTPVEWTLREVLRHMIVVERRYAIQTLHAAERRDDEPVRIEDERLRAADVVDVRGDAATVLARFADARRQTQGRLGALPAAALTRPSIWAGYEIDVRFRLHRFAAHIVEHTIHCEKTLAALGRHEEEGRRIVRRIWAVRGELEGLEADDALRRLDTALSERMTTLGTVLTPA